MKHNDFCQKRQIVASKSEHVNHKTQFLHVCSDLSCQNWSRIDRLVQNSINFLRTYRQVGAYKRLLKRIVDQTLLSKICRCRKVVCFIVMCKHALKQNNKFLYLFKWKETILQASFHKSEIISSMFDSILQLKRNNFAWFYWSIRNVYFN